jgi:hypothetical protein
MARDSALGRRKQADLIRIDFARDVSIGFVSA